MQAIKGEARLAEVAVAEARGKAQAVEEAKYAPSPGKRPSLAPPGAVGTVAAAAASSAVLASISKERDDPDGAAKVNAAPTSQPRPPLARPVLTHVPSPLFPWSLSPWRVWGGSR